MLELIKPRIRTSFSLPFRQSQVVPHEVQIELDNEFSLAEVNGRSRGKN